MNLPKLYCERMKAILGSEYENYISSIDNKAFRGLRINTLKTNKNNLEKYYSFLKEPTLFYEESYYIPEDVEKLGNDVLHHAGAFYIQEPSASSAVSALNIEKGDIVLDLCAAPGGKSTQIAAELDGTGLLVSNEYVSQRVNALVSNIERMGIINAVVTSNDSETLCKALPCVFDKILVDAPCSGEGMMRKETAALENWSIDNIKLCADRQLEILNNATISLKDGGFLCYSTCTFAYEENEQVVERFLKLHKNFKLIEINKKFGRSAFKKYAPDTENIEYARRILPMDKGEGHFIALMKKEKIQENAVFFEEKFEKNDIFNEFFENNFKEKMPDNIIKIGDRIYISPKTPNMSGVNVIRSGIFAGHIEKNRFIPSHALFATNKFEPLRIIDLQPEDMLIKKFLHGEEIDCDENFKGYVSVRVCGIPLGFGKASNGRLKNHYPKGLRTL